MKKSIIIGLFIIFNLNSCAPHGHIYKLINSKTENEEIEEINVSCQITDKTFLINSDEKVDSIVLYSKTLDEKCISLIMHDSLIKIPHYKFRINDKKFHKLFNSDTLELKIKKDNTWKKIYYKSIPDNYSK